MKKILYRFYKNYQHKTRDKLHWNKRIALVTESPDNAKINHVENAGKVEGKFQIMHNGQRIHIGSYYGKPIAAMLKKNKGVHEPQEEYAFQEIISALPEKPVMIELGAYWGFYSMWLKQVKPNAKVFLAEPELENLQMGINNFIANNLIGAFIHAATGTKTEEMKDNTPVFSVDDIIKNYQIQFVDILHSDIQGYEFNMLQGAVNAITSHSIGYIFVSTHSALLHKQCIDFLQQHQYNIVCDADMDATYSYDGLIVAKSFKYNGIQKLDISKRK